ncbi:MAG: hypothetical protein JWO08_610 [Verrucomicrobiaceae bacterium]|nr:hypothetical protein [Verrucomicrobiaceae bacterium]
MAAIDSSRVFEVSELDAVTAPPIEGDKFLVSRGRRSGGMLLTELFNWVKASLEGYYLKVPTGLAAPPSAEDGDKTYLLKGTSQFALTLSTLSSYIKGKLDPYYIWGGATSQLPAIPSLQGAVLQAGASAGTVVWSAGTGSGGTITQSGTRSTAVTLNKQSGQITMNATSLAAGAMASFTVNNSYVAATDVVVINVKSPATGTLAAFVTAVASGSFQVTVRNHGAAADTTVCVLQYTVLRASNS